MENASPDKTALKRSRVTAMVFAALTILSLLLLVYAFIQKAESERLMSKVLECEASYKEAQEKLEQERIRAEENLVRAQRALEDALKAEQQARQNMK